MNADDPTTPGGSTYSSSSSNAVAMALGGFKRGRLPGMGSEGKNFRNFCRGSTSQTASPALELRNVEQKLLQTEEKLLMAEEKWKSAEERLERNEAQLNQLLNWVNTNYPQAFTPIQPSRSLNQDADDDDDERLD